MLKNIMKRLLVTAIIFTLSAPVSGLCEALPADYTPSQRGSNDGSAGLWVGAGVGLLIGGIWTLSSANSYESKYDNPYKYDQDDVKSKANTLRTLGAVEIGLGALCAIVGINKMQVNKSTEVSIDTVGGTPMIFAKHIF